MHQVVVLLSLLVLWLNPVGSLSSSLSQMLPLCRIWILSQFSSSGIQIDSPWSQSHIVRMFANILIWLPCFAAYLLSIIYFDSLLSSIIADLINTGQTLCMLQVDMISLLAPYIQSSDASSFVSLSVSWVDRESFLSR